MPQSLHQCNTTHLKCQDEFSSNTTKFLCNQLCHFSYQPSFNFNSFILFWFCTDTGNQSHESKYKNMKNSQKIHSLLPTTTRIIKLYYRLLEAILNFKFTEHHFPRLVKTWSLHKRITVKTHLFVIRYIATTSMISQYIYTTFTNIKKWVTHCLKADANQALILWYNRDRKALLLAWILLQNS